MMNIDKNNHKQNLLLLLHLFFWAKVPVEMISMYLILIGWSPLFLYALAKFQAYECRLWWYQHNSSIYMNNDSPRTMVVKQEIFDCFITITTTTKTKILDMACRFVFGYNNNNNKFLDFKIGCTIL